MSVPNTVIAAFSADRGLTLDGGSNVERWADLTGRGFDLVQATAGSRPAYAAGAVYVAAKTLLHVVPVSGVNTIVMDLSFPSLRPYATAYLFGAPGGDRSLRLTASGAAYQLTTASNTGPADYTYPAGGGRVDGTPGLNAFSAGQRHVVSARRGGSFSTSLYAHGLGSAFTGRDPYASYYGIALAATTTDAELADIEAWVAAGLPGAAATSGMRLGTRI